VVISSHNGKSENKISNGLFVMISDAKGYFNSSFKSLSTAAALSVIDSVVELDRALILAGKF
jgi:hypothetical protein